MEAPQKQKQRTCQSLSSSIHGSRGANDGSGFRHDRQSGKTPLTVAIDTKTLPIEN